MKNEATLPSQLPLSAIEELHRHWALFFALGIILILLGGMGISAAGLVTLASVVFFGWLLIIGGAAVAIHAFWAKRWSGFFLQLLSGVLYLIVGLDTCHTARHRGADSDSSTRHLPRRAGGLSHRRGIEHTHGRLGHAPRERHHYARARVNDLERVAPLGNLGDRTIRGH